MSNKLNHIALILDGNKRWAKFNGYSKTTGYSKGFENIKNLVNFSLNINLKNLLSLQLNQTNNQFELIKDKFKLGDFYSKKILKIRHRLDHSMQNAHVLRFAGTHMS